MHFPHTCALGGTNHVLVLLRCCLTANKWTAPLNCSCYMCRNVASASLSMKMKWRCGRFHVVITFMQAALISGCASMPHVLCANIISLMATTAIRKRCEGKITNVLLWDDSYYQNLHKISVFLFAKRLEDARRRRLVSSM